MMTFKDHAFSDAAREDELSNMPTEEDIDRFVSSCRTDDLIRFSVAFRERFALTEQEATYLLILYGYANKPKNWKRRES